MSFKILHSVTNWTFYNAACKIWQAEQSTFVEYVPKCPKWHGVFMFWQLIVSLLLNNSTPCKYSFIGQACKHEWRLLLRKFCRILCQTSCHWGALLVIEEFPQDETETSARSYAREECQKFGTSCKCHGKVRRTGISKLWDSWEGEGGIWNGCWVGNQQMSIISVTQTGSVPSTYPPLSLYHLWNIMKWSVSLSLLDCDHGLCYDWALEDFQPHLPNP